MITTYGQSGTAIRLGSSVSAIPGEYAVIGTGSATITAGTSGCVTETDRIAKTGSTDFTTPQKLIFTYDRNSVQMSGTLLTEWAVHTGSPGSANDKAWQVENFAAVTFDGTNELQLEITWQVY